MIKWIIILLVIAVIASALGYSRVSRVAGRAAAVLIIVGLIIVAVVLWLFSLAAGAG